MIRDMLGQDEFPVKLSTFHENREATPELCAWLSSGLSQAEPYTGAQSWAQLSRILHYTVAALSERPRALSSLSETQVLSLAEGRQRRR